MVSEAHKKMVFYVLIVVLSIAVAYKKSVHPLGRTAGPGPNDETSDSVSKSDIPLIAGGIGGSVLAGVLLWYINKHGGSRRNIRPWT